MLTATDSHTSAALASIMSDRVCVWLPCVCVCRPLLVVCVRFDSSLYVQTAKAMVEEPGTEIPVVGRTPSVPDCGPSTWMML